MAGGRGRERSDGAEDVSWRVEWRNRGRWRALSKGDGGGAKGAEQERYCRRGGAGMGIPEQ